MLMTRCCCQVTKGAWVKFSSGTMTINLLPNFLCGSYKLRFYYNTESIFYCKKDYLKTPMFNNFPTYFPILFAYHHDHTKF